MKAVWCLLLVACLAARAIRAADPCADAEPGAARVRCYQEHLSALPFRMNRIHGYLAGAAWKFCETQGGHFRLYHCNAKMASSCEGGALCPTEFFLKPGKGGLTDSQLDDVKKGLGLFTFTRPICPKTMKHGGIHNYNLASKSHCAIIDPEVLLDQMFFVNAGDTGKTGVPVSNQNPINLLSKADAKGEVSEANWIDWFATNERQFQPAFTRAGSSEVNLVGCIPLQYVKAIDSTDPSSLAACKAKNIPIREVTSNSEIRDLPFESDEKMDGMGRLAVSFISKMPDVKDTAVYGAYTKKMTTAFAKGQAALRHQAEKRRAQQSQEGEHQ